ncbi:hypothetical protein DM860_010320 [Cuscuta australis]|uniref:DYW domain-containing protein n=1 Tax=Cuscuta australis TaxID=267555 RepID=A0A328D7K6_9ASTE|nr:hypothetical protein DM860_010320 [Cuscuta australis]
MMVAVRITANHRGRVTSSLRFAHFATFRSQASYSSLSSQETHYSNADYQMLICTLEACKHNPKSWITTTTHCKMIKSGYAKNPSLLRLLIMAYLSCNCPHPARQLLSVVSEWDFDVLSGNLMIVSFMKMKEVNIAKEIFTKMPSRDLITWNSMIGGFVKNRLHNEALSTFRKMLVSEMQPDGYTFASVMTACAKLGDLHRAKHVHNLMIERNIQLNYILSTALIDMYSKCGNIKTAREVFSSVECNNVCVWNAMINGLRTHGLASEAIEVFEQMEAEAILPDSITFVALLTALSHCGLVEEGKRHFDLMKKGHFLVRPQLEHYGAMVDLLGRAGLLDEAYSMIKEMPMEPDVVIWRTFLSSCRTHKNSELGEVAATEISHLTSGDYVLMSNIYCSVKRWDSAEELREAMKQNGVRKTRGRSWVETGNTVHVFNAGDRSHPEMNVIYKSLKVLVTLSKMEGFHHETELVLMDISEEEKEENLALHSEKLALVYGILKSGGPKDIIRVTKNLRTCLDCHSWMKVVSKVLNRVIVVRDRVRFHHFEGGLCTCGDFW